jgi:hypothetical protein
MGSDGGEGFCSNNERDGAIGKLRNHGSGGFNRMPSSCQTSRVTW